MTPRPAFARRVALGAELLDRYQPGWAHLVDLDRLNLLSVKSCPLGQLYGDFDQGRAQLLTPHEVDEVACGFNLDHDADYPPGAAWDAFDRLTTVWWLEIFHRQHPPATDPAAQRG